MNITKRKLLLLPMALWLGVSGGCHALEVGGDGPGMMLVYGSVIDGRSVSIKSATTSSGTHLTHPLRVGGRFTPGQTWRNGGVDATMAASGDHRGLPEWVDFTWQEPSYPGLEPKDFPDRMAFRQAVKEMFSKLPMKAQRLEIKRRVPQSVVDEVVASKRVAQPGSVADKTLWIFIFWTPDGVKMRWAMYDKKLARGGFGAIAQEGGDDLDRYNR